MTIFFDVLRWVALALTFSAVASSALQVFRRHRAEQQMRQLFLSNAELSAELRAIRVKVEQARASEEIDAEFYALADAKLQMLAEQLTGQYRKLVLLSLRQPSVVGRRNYIGKLLQAA